MNYLFNNSKYTKWYYQIIDDRKENPHPNELYTEKHHIIPKSLGGSNKKENLIRLSAREHFLVHWLLTKMCANPVDVGKMQYAMRSFSWNKDGNRIISSWQFSLCREMSGKSNKGRNLSKEHKEKISISGKKRFSKKENRIAMSNSLKNSEYKHTKEHKEKIGSSTKIRYESEDERRKTSEATKAGMASPEFRKKRSKDTKQRYEDRPELREMVGKFHRNKPKEKVQCPCCGKVGGKNVMYRWHFDNCKFKD